MRGERLKVRCGRGGRTVLGTGRDVRGRAAPSGCTRRPQRHVSQHQTPREPAGPRAGPTAGCSRRPGSAAATGAAASLGLRGRPAPRRRRPSRRWIRLASPRGVYRCREPGDQFSERGAPEQNHDTVWYVGRRVAHHGSGELTDQHRVQQRSGPRGICPAYAGGAAPSSVTPRRVTRSRSVASSRSPSGHGPCPDAVLRCPATPQSWSCAPQAPASCSARA